MHFCKQMAAHSYIIQEAVARGVQENLQSRSYLESSKERKPSNVLQSLQSIHHRLKANSKMQLNKHRDIVNFLCLCITSPYHQEEWAAAASVGTAHTQRIDLQLLFRSKSLHHTYRPCSTSQHHNFQQPRTPGAFCTPDSIHVDWVTIPGAVLSDLMQAWTIDYKRERTP